MGQGARNGADPFLFLLHIRSDQVIPVLLDEARNVRSPVEVALMAEAHRLYAQIVQSQNHKHGPRLILIFD